MGMCVCECVSMCVCVCVSVSVCVCECECECVHATDIKHQIDQKENIPFVMPANIAIANPCWRLL